MKNADSVIIKKIASGIWRRTRQDSAQSTLLTSTILHQAVYDVLVDSLNPEQVTIWSTAVAVGGMYVGFLGLHY